MNKRLSWLWLSAKDELSALVKMELLQTFGTPDHLYAMSREELIRTTRLTKRQVDALSDKSLARAEAIVFDCEKLGITILALEDSAYPEILRSIPDPPLVLYVKGCLPDLEAAPGIGIVGTRKATPYGILAANRFGKGLAAAGFTIVSGMALGADAAAAQGALQAGGKTIAVLAGGLNICYPPEHNFLMRDIQCAGAVISENPPGTRHDGFRFPIRNRIISGLSRALLVAEAPIRSGALITAHLALDQGREVFAVPGNIDASGSAGCNQLIRKGEAALATGPEDIIAELGVMLREKPNPVNVREAVQTNQSPQSVSDLWNQILGAEEKKYPQHPKKQQDAVIAEGANEVQRQILQAVQEGAETPEEILERTDFAVARVMTELTMLELNGLLERQNGIIKQK